MDRVVFRLCDKAPGILREVCLERGWEEYCEDECEADGRWNLWWKTQGFTSSEYETCRPWQRLNHFPKSVNITKKDGLARNLRRMKTSYGGSIFDFFPRTFILPNEYKKFVAEFSKQEGDQGPNYWICKPTEQSCGRGIFIFQDLRDLTYDCAVVVQKYIIKPFLISGYKFDLRLYAIVKSFHPFQLYVYHEGIVRFSTERFDMSTLNNRFSHLTNTSINKTGPQYSAEKESIGIGCKWTLSQLRVYLHKHNIDDRLLWHRITTIIILTLLSQVHNIPSGTSNCFEMFGFDILVDEKMKPWLLEVNFSPALGNDCTQDDFVKRPLLNDILEILNFSEVDIKRGGKGKENAVTNKKSFKKRHVKYHTPKSINKPKLSKHVDKPSSTTILNDAGRENESDPQMGLASKNTNKSLREKGSVFGTNGDKRKKSFQRCQTQCPNFSLLYHKRQGTSEGFQNATMDECDVLVNSNLGKEDLKEIESPFHCTSKECDHTEKSQSFFSGVTEHENRDSSEVCAEEDENITRMPKILVARSQTRQMGSLLDFSFLEHNSVGQSCHLCIHCYNVEVSSMNSLKTANNNAVPQSSTGNICHWSWQHSSKVSRAVQQSKKATCVTLKPQIGNCVLAFPFNDITFKASQGKLDQKVIIHEMRKMLKAISFDIKSSSSDVRNDNTELDLSKPFWGYRSKLNTFYSTLQSKGEE